MTRNTLTYLGLQETKRSNMAKEAETQRHNLATELQAKKELSELISNNLRVHGINLDKNQITRIANDQLNQRELAKLQETFRHNVENEDIGYQQAYAAILNAKKTKSFWEALGMYLPAEILNKWGTNLGVGADQVLSTLFGSPLDNNPQKQYQKGYTGDRDVSYNPSTNTWVTSQGKLRSGKSTYNKRIKEEENEVPTDFTNSKGPGGKVNENVSNKVEAFGGTAPTTNAQNQQSNNTSKSYDTTNSYGTRVIISPGVRKKLETGPGVGIAYS